jgi:hypothetical protein
MEHPGGGIGRGRSLETKIRILTQIIDGLLQYAREIVPVAGFVRVSRFSECRSCRDPFQVAATKRLRPLHFERSGEPGLSSGRQGVRPVISRLFVVACSGCAIKDTIRKMGLLDEDSDETHYLRKLVIGYPQKEIDLTDDSTSIIAHNPESCPSCTDWYKAIREIGEANPYLFDKDGYLKRSVLEKLSSEIRERLNEIGQLVSSHLKMVHDDTLEKQVQAAADDDKFRWS